MNHREGVPNAICDAVDFNFLVHHRLQKRFPAHLAPLTSLPFQVHLRQVAEFFADDLLHIGEHFLGLYFVRLSSSEII
jgi:hypothetical protein